MLVVVVAVAICGAFSALVCGTFPCRHQHHRHQQLVERILQVAAASQQKIKKNPSRSNRKFTPSFMQPLGVCRRAVYSNAIIQPYVCIQDTCLLEVVVFHLACYLISKILALSATHRPYVCSSFLSTLPLVAVYFFLLLFFCYLVIVDSTFLQMLSQPVNQCIG